MDHHAAMRIGVLMLNRGRGSGEVARDHVAALVGSGHRVCLLHPVVGDGVPGADRRDVRLHAPVVPVHEFLPVAGSEQQPVAEIAAPVALAYADDYEAALDDVAADLDVIVAHHANLTAIAAHRVAYRHGLPFAVFVHGTGIEPRHHGGYADEVWQAIEAALGDASGLIVTTEYVRDRLVRPLVDVPLDRFLVLPCGVDANILRPQPGERVRAKYGLPETYVISPGALSEAKGPQNVVAASHHYADIAPTVFVGDGPLRADLESALGDRGRFLGFVPDEDKNELIGAATVLTAAPEKLEHFGIIYVEALASGTVPVAYRGGGVDSIVVPGTGVLTDRNPAALGAEVRRLLESPADLDAMAIAGRARAAEHFSASALAARLEEWLMEIVAEHEASRSA